MGQDERREGRDAVATEPAQAGPVRRRVARHLRSLLVPGILGLGACENPLVNDPVPPPTTGTPETRTPPGTTTAATATTTTSSTTTPTETPPVVCDPMPRPQPPPKK